MRLLRLGPVVAWIATFSQVAGVWAYPSSSSAGFVARDDDDDLYQLKSRAPPVHGSITVPLLKESNHNTWIGYRFWPGLVGATVSDQAVRDTAYQTYKEFEDKLPLPGLVSVMYVPGGGWAAGTVWQGSDEGFNDFALKAAAFWHSVPVNEQDLNPQLNGVHKWHAEAVAVAKAEQEFEDAMVEGLWPKGTKIYTYGKVWAQNRFEVGPKPICRDGRSQVLVSCSEWLERLQIGIVPLP